MKNLIIGIIKNYKFDDLKPFVITLEKTGYKGDVVFLYDNVDPVTISKLRQHGVTPIPWSEPYPYLSKEYTKDMGIVPATYHRKIHLFSLRYITYYLYLKNCGKNYDNIMLADIRDIIFQKDPFDFDINNNLCCSLEAADWPISRSDFNGGEIRAAFGEDAFEKIKHNPISNCGVTIGPEKLILAYLEKMISFILAGDGSILMDQGTHNYILWNHMVPNIKFYKNNAGPILTLGYEKIVNRNKQKQILDMNGTLINIIHQYDRHLMVAKDYYTTRMKIKYARIFIRNRIIKTSWDNVSAAIKKSSPKTHAFLKKIKKCF